jgi:hypothetical protein
MENVVVELTAEFVQWRLCSFTVIFFMLKIEFGAIFNKSEVKILPWRPPQK